MGPILANNYPITHKLTKIETVQATVDILDMVPKKNSKFSHKNLSNEKLVTSRGLQPTEILCRKIFAYFYV